MKINLLCAVTLLISITLTAGIMADARSLKPRPHMLREDSRPPDFTRHGQEVVDGTGTDQDVKVSLHMFLGRKRIVIVFSPPKSYLDSLSSREYDERDLVVLAIFRPNDPLLTVAARPLYMLVDNSGEVFREYHAVEGQPMYYLIGKDGGIKMARLGIPNERELFSTIDAMPMRRLEIRQRGR